MALKACDDAVRQYWICRNDQGLMVIFKCREELKHMNSCLKEWNGDASRYEEYRKKRLAELEQNFGNGTPNPEYMGNKTTQR